MKRSVLLLMLILLSLSAFAQKDNDGWISLFDGKTTEGWRAFNGKEMPPGWIVKDGVLYYDTKLGLEQNYKGGKDILYGKETFDNFELYIEWKIPEGGNSGIFYHVKEGFDAPWVTGPEYQLIDDENYAAIHDISGYNKSVGVKEHPERLQGWQSTAADYGMYAPDPSKKVLHPAGEWNTTRIVFTPERVEHWLNGQLVLAFVPWSKDWYEHKKNGKWKNDKHYGKYKSGYICLQDHASPIWFRNIKIKKL